MSRARPPAVLILAGFDPSGGAGLLADAEAVREIGARPLCVPTALTVQSPSRARGFTPVSPDYFLEAASALLEEEPVRALKIGMLASPGIARAIETLLADPRLANVPVILDPVLAASSGAPLFRGEKDPLSEARAAISSLWTRALVTPNAHEAQLLLGLPEIPRSEEALEAAGQQLLEAGAQAVLIKGGHAAGPEAVDLLLQRESPASGAAAPFWNADLLHADEIALYTNEPDSAWLRISRFAGPRLFHGGSPEGKQLEARGTGCRFASALAASVALGKSPLEAAGDAKALVARYLRHEGNP